MFNMHKTKKIFKMKTKNLLSTLALAGTLCVANAQTARLQIIHNSSDALADSVDVYVNGGILKDNFAFRNATEFMDVPAGTTLNIGVAPKTSTSVNDTIANFPTTFTSGKTYIVVANGLIGNMTTPFGLFATDMGQENAASSANTDVLVFHGATDAPTVDVTVTGGSPTLANDLAYGAFAGYLNLPTNNYSIEVRDASGSVVVAAYEAPLAALGLDSAAITVVASGFLAPTSNQPAFGLWAATANGGELIPLPTSTARLQVIHNSADANADSVDVYLNGTSLLDNFAFRTATPFIDINAGVTNNIGVALKNSTTAADTLVNFPVVFEPNKTYVVIANGLVGNNTTPFGLFAYDMAREKADQSSNTDVLIFHGSTDAPTVDITVAGGTPTLSDDLAYGTFENYNELPTANYSIDVRDQSGSTVVASYEAPLSTLNLDSASISVVASGFLSPTGNQPSFGLWVALANGGNLVPLTNVTSINTTSNILNVQFPNPIKNQGILELNLSDNSPVNVSIVNILGETVYRKNLGTLNKGVYRENINVEQMSNGVYLLNIEQTNSINSYKILINN